MNKKEELYIDKIIKRMCEIYIDIEYEKFMKDMEDDEFNESEFHEFSDRFYKKMDKIIENESLKNKKISNDDK